MSEKKYAEPIGNPGMRRPIAILLWVLGIIFEVVGIMILIGKITIFSNPILWICIALVIDFVLVVIGSALWKQANKIDPPSEKNQVEFFLKTQLGSIIAVIAFLPILIFLLSDKNLDKKAKTWVSLLAALLLAGSVLLGIDFNPISLEDLQQMEVNSVESEFGEGIVQWSKNSKVYHTWDNCPALKRIKEENKREDVVKVAFEAGKARMCYFCADHFGITAGVESKEPTIGD